MKNINKKLLVIVSVLLLIGGISVAYFVVTNILRGEGSKTKANVANIDDMIIKLEGELEFNDVGIYPGHQSLSVLKISIEGEENQGAYKLVWNGTNTFNTSLNYTVYKSEEALTSSDITCEVITKVVDGKQLLSEKCDVLKPLGKKLSSGTIPISSTTKETTILDPEFISGSTAKDVIYYNVIIEYPNDTENSQNNDIGVGEFSGVISIKESEVEPDISIAHIYKMDNSGIYQEDENIPTKDEGYILNDEESTCSNGVTAEWDTNNWALLLHDLNEEGTTCNLYFDIE